MEKTLATNEIEREKYSKKLEKELAEEKATVTKLIKKFHEKRIKIKGLSRRLEFLLGKMEEKMKTAAKKLVREEIELKKFY
jgi:uncharacterized coiled-coil protein SlyX